MGLTMSVGKPRHKSGIESLDQNSNSELNSDDGLIFKGQE